MIREYSEQIIAYLKDNGPQDNLPRYEERKAWEEIPEELREKIIVNAGKLTGYEWPQLKASEYYEFFDDGVHGGIYHQKFNKRRNILGQFLMAECVEGKGRFLKDIVNGIFCICEESTWVVPQHNAIINKLVTDNKIPSRDTAHIDLFAAETGSLLSWCLYFLRKPLDDMSVNICARIEDELMHRIIKPYLASDELHWMGLKPGTGGHGNWNTWINCNCSVTFLYGCRDRLLTATGIEKVIRSIHNYIDFVTDEGGCNEGPVYWTIAAGMVYDFMDILFKATGEQFPMFDSEKFKNMGKFIYRLYVGDHTYVNFADAPAKDPGTKDGGLLYRYGKTAGDDRLRDLGAAVFKRNIKLLSQRETFQLSQTNNTFRGYWNLSNLFTYKEMMASEADAPYVRDAFIGDVQIAVAREQEGSPKGFFICAKGGHNHESHNHNDVGHFVLYHNEKPVCIDPGNLPYTLAYFNKDTRYTYWATQSAYHNLPTVGYSMQLEGSDSKATNTDYNYDDNGMTYKLGIETCYPEEAGVEMWTRTFRLKRTDDKAVEICEDFQLKKGITGVYRSMVTPRTVRVEGDDTIIFESFEGAPEVKAEVESGLFDIEVDTIDLSELPKMQADWGMALYRVRITAKEAVDNGNWTMKMTEVTA